MALRKINAGISLLVAFLVLVHAISCAVWMLSMGSIPNVPSFVPWTLTGAMALHAFISIDLAISGHMDGKSHKTKNYPKMNVSTIVQRASGMLMIIFTVLHIAGTVGYLQPPKVVHAILPPLFFVVVLVHTAVSISKAFVTIGIGNAKFIKTADVVSKTVCAATLIAGLIGFYLYLV